MVRGTQNLLRHIPWIVLIILFLAPLPSFGSSPQELLEVGTGAFQDGFYQVAEAQFREFLRASPQHAHIPKVMYLLGRTLYEQKKFVEAKDTFITLLASNTVFQAKDSAYFWLGRCCEQLDDISSAQSNLLTIVTKYPQSAWYYPALFLLGKLSFDEGRYKRAEMYLRKVLHNEDADIGSALSCSTKFWLGLSLYEQRRYRETENLFQEVVDSKVKTDLREEALYWLGEAHIQLKQYKKGAAVFRTLLECFPQSALTAHALYGESLCLYMCGRKTEALNELLILKKVFSHTSLLPHILSFMGEIYIDLDRYQEAIEIFREFLSRYPHTERRIQVLGNLGWCHLMQGDVEQFKTITYEIVERSQGGWEKELAQYSMAAINTYEGTCQEALPYWFNLLNSATYRQEALFRIAVCFFQERKFKESLVNIDLLQLEYPNFYKMDEALWIQGESYRELANISEATKAYQNVVREHKRSSWYPWSVYRMIAFSLYEKDIKGAERYFESLHKRFPYHKLSYEVALQLGTRKAQERDYESALHYLTIATGSSNNTIARIAFCWQGEIYFTKHEYQKAWDAYQKVISEHPSSKDMLSALAYLEMGNIRHLLNDYKKAKEVHKKALEISGDERFKEEVKLLLKDLQEEYRRGT
jgi:TolA-binding protein